MTPPQFAHDDIATIVVRLPNLDGMVTALTIILRVLFFGGRLDLIAGG